jgi:hypothetical protein
MRRRAVWFVTVALASGALLLPGASSAQQAAQTQFPAAKEPCDHSAMWKQAQDVAP